MKIGIIPVNIAGSRPERLIDLVRTAEAAGIESAWTFEHVVVPVDYASRYPYDAAGKMPGTPPETPFLDPFVALTFAAAHSTTLRLGTGVNILPQANPLYFAKQAASLDVLSGGRLLLGVGVGWLREEYAALGVPFERRGERFDDYLSAIKQVWSGEVVEHQSPYLQWSGFKSYPRPAQRPNPPLIIGGDTEPALRRVVRSGDGWFAPADGLDDLRPKLGRLRELATEAGRNAASIPVSTLWVPAEGADSVARYAEAGVERLIVPLHTLGKRNPATAVKRLADLLNLG